MRQLINLKDATLLGKLIKLMAGRAGQVVNYPSQANGIGMDNRTVKHWLSSLEASFSGLHTAALC